MNDRLSGSFFCSIFLFKHGGCARWARSGGEIWHVGVIEGEEVVEIVHGEAADDAFFAGDDGIGKGLFFLFKLEDLFFDGVFGDEADDVDAFFLADAVGR